MNPDISVIIPTCNRLEILKRTLAALEQQEQAPSFEVIVADDGSSDGTSDFLASFKPSYSFHFLRQENKGPAAARNAAVKKAEAPVCALLGDDTIPDRQWLSRHAAAHAEPSGQHPKAVLGLIDWHPEIKVTPFLRYITTEGVQFGYPNIDQPDNVPFQHFYTSNISLPTELLLKEPLDESFPSAAWEDTELSYRLCRKHGLKIIYRKEAVVYHHHQMNLASFARRQEKAGYNAVLFYHRCPELSLFLGVSPLGPPAYELSHRRFAWYCRLARWVERLPINLEQKWEVILRHHYIGGIHQGLSDHPLSQPA